MEDPARTRRVRLGQGKAAQPYPLAAAARFGEDRLRSYRTGSIGWDVAPSSLNASCTRLQLTLAGRATMGLQTIAPRRCQRTRARAGRTQDPRHPLRSGGDRDEDLAQMCRDRD